MMISSVLAENVDPNVLVMKSAKDQRKYDAVSVIPSKNQMSAIFIRCKR